jgi:hypothetical protein
VRSIDYRVHINSSKQGKFSPPDIFLAKWQTPIFESPSPCPDLGAGWVGTIFWPGALIEKPLPSSFI